MSTTERDQSRLSSVVDGMSAELQAQFLSRLGSLVAGVNIEGDVPLVLTDAAGKPLTREDALKKIEQLIADKTGEAIDSIHTIQGQLGNYTPVETPDAPDASVDLEAPTT